MKINEKNVRRAAGSIFFAAIVLALVALIGIGALALGNSRARSSPYMTAKKHIESLSANELYGKLSGYLNKNITEYENIADVEDKIKEQLSKGEISFARSDGFKASSPKYTVYLNGREVYTLSLSKTVLLSNAYKVKSLKISSNMALGNDIIIEVPTGATVTVNGKELERDISNPSPYYRLSEFETALSDEIRCDRYSLGRFFLTPDVSVVYEGKRLQASSIGDGILRFDYPSDMTASYSFTVPEGAVLKINGITADREYITDSKVAYPFLSRFESELSGMPSARVYQISGLFSEPEISVTYNGVELTCEDGAYRLPGEMTKTIVIMAPDYATVRINGVALSSTEITQKKCELPILSGVTTYAKQRPYLTEYTVSGLLAPSMITATDKNGEPLGVNGYYSEDGKVVFNCTTSGEPNSTVTKALTNYTKAYIKYVYSGNNGLENNYNAATAYTPYNSSAYYALKDTYRTLYNAPQYKNISYGTLYVLEYYKYSDSAYSAIVRMSCTATHNGEKVEFTVILEILGNFSGSRRWINYKVL